MIRRVVLELFLLGFVIYYGVQYIDTLRGYDPLASVVTSEGPGSTRTGTGSVLSFVPAQTGDIADKNPFHPDRGFQQPVSVPEAVAPIEVEPPPPPPLPIALKGIVLDNEGDRIAVMTEGEGQARLMREGDTFSEVTVLSIEPDRVTIVRPTGEEVLYLRELRTIDVEDESGGH